MPEIFQLISTGRRTGTLGIVRNRRATMFYFNEGQITYAYSPDGNSRLGHRLIKKGFIDDKTITESLSDQKKHHGQKRLGRILIDADKIDDKQLESVLIEQVSDTVYRVMGWDKGVFKFYDNKFPTEEDQSLSLSTEGLILEGAKRADDLKHLRSKLPAFDKPLMIKKSTNSSEMDLKLTADQWNILALCDGRRAIDDIVDRSDDNLLTPLKALVKLLELDLIEPLPINVAEINDVSHLELQVGKLADLLDKFLANN
ncbi:MAG: DUF4388 domain-containing protein [candidate division Zixibacteria bacterium]|nr:DUF4388 domain-containing protein [candidate division Zixibacteria bacterium]